MTSIRRYLIAVLLTAIAIVNFAAVWYGYRNSVAETEQLFDKRLADITAVLAATPPGYYSTATGDSAIAFQIWQGDALEAASRNIPPAAPITALEPGYSNVRIGGFRWRAFARYLPESDRWIIVAESEDIRLALADSIVLDSVLPIVLGLPICGLLIWVVVGRGLQPLNSLATAMHAKRSDDLTPVESLDTPKELTVLIDSINDLLRRLDAAFERERQFAADAAHALRTPISVLKIQLHNLLQDAQPEDPRLASLEDQVERLRYSVEQVLMLHRTTPEQFAARFEKTDLTSIARQTIADLYPQIEARGQQIELEGSAAEIRGDTFALQMLLTNLIENASRYSGEGGTITVRIESGSTLTALTVEDSGPGIPQEQREHVFERFYRGEHDSAPDGTGIGLAIVKNVAQIHSARVDLGKTSSGKGLAVKVVFSSGE